MSRENRVLRAVFVLALAGLILALYTATPETAGPAWAIREYLSHLLGN